LKTWLPRGKNSKDEAIDANEESTENQVWESDI